MNNGYISTPIGDIPKDWQVVKLEQLINKDRGITYGIVQPGPYDPNGRYLVRGKDYSTGWVGPEDFFRVSDKIEAPYKRARLKENDLITTIVGAGVGNMQIVPKWLEGANITQTTARIAIDESKGDYKFYYQVLCSQIGKYNVRLFEKGGAQPGLNLADIKKYLVPLPLLCEQQRIAEILSTVDEKIDVIDAQISQATELKKGLMQKLLTKGIGHTQFKDSPLGEIPESWEVVKQEQVATFYNGRAYKLSEWENYGIPVIRLQNLTGTGKEYYYSNLKLPVHQYCENGDLLYMWSATFGPVWWKGNRAIYHYHIWKIDVDEESLDKAFHYYLLDDVTVRMKNQSHGSTMLHVTKGGMEKLNIVLPPLHEQKKIALILTTIDKKLEVLQEKKECSLRLKKGLMQQLLTGKIRVTQSILQNATA